MAISISFAPPPPPTLEGVGRVESVEVSIKETPAEVTVCVAGEAGISQVGDLTAALLGVSARRPELVTLDLGGLRFVSCLAMSVLVTFRRGVVRAGGRVRLADTLQQPVREALVRADLLALFESPEGPSLTRKEEVQP
jgi:anti-anti-sigma factor